METTPNLVEIDSLRGFRVAADECDPRGWGVIDCEGDQVGIVQTLLIDTELMKARYLVTQLESSRRVLLPVPLARLDEHAKRVIFDVSPAESFSALPDYVGTQPTPAEDDVIHMVLIGTERAVGSPEISPDRRHSSRRATAD
jgi:hypothetical protein